MNFITSDIQVTEQTGSVEVCFAIGDLQIQIDSTVLSLITKDIIATGIIKYQKFSLLR